MKRTRFSCGSLHQRLTLTIFESKRIQLLHLFRLWWKGLDVVNNKYHDAPKSCFYYRLVYRVKGLSELPFPLLVGHSHNEDEHKPLCERENVGNGGSFYLDNQNRQHYHGQAAVINDIKESQFVTRALPMRLQGIHFQNHYLVYSCYTYLHHSRNFPNSGKVRVSRVYHILSID